MTDAIYTQGDTVMLHTDIFPGFVHPLPQGVPGRGFRKRVIVTERCLTIGWAVSGQIYRIDIPMTEEQTAMATLRGGPVGEYMVGRDQGCGSCGAGLIRNYKFWPGIHTTTVPRTEVAAAALKTDKTYGLPSNRYTRARP